MFFAPNSSFLVAEKPLVCLFQTDKIMIEKLCNYKSTHC